MIGILWLIVCLVIGIPMIISPGKILERPNCKIKSPAAVRALGVAVVVLGVISFIL